MSNENGNGFAGLDALAKSATRRYGTVETDVGTFRIQSLNAKEWIEYQSTLLVAGGGVMQHSKPGMINSGRRLVVMCLVNDQGDRLLDFERDKQLIDGIDQKVMGQLTDGIRDFCGLRKDEDELEKN